MMHSLLHHSAQLIKRCCLWQSSRLQRPSKLDHKLGAVVFDIFRTNEGPGHTYPECGKAAPGDVKRVAACRTHLKVSQGPEHLDTAGGSFGGFNQVGAEPPYRKQLGGQASEIPFGHVAADPERGVSLIRRVSPCFADGQMIRCHCFFTIKQTSTQSERLAVFRE